MKRISVVIVVALIVCVGLETGCSTSKQQTPSPVLYGQYTGTMTGTNFTDPALILNFTSSSTGLTVDAAIGGETCNGGQLNGGSLIVISGLSFSGSSGSSVSGNTFSINGTASDGQSLNGTITLSNPPDCGTATDPWTGTFMATAVPGTGAVGQFD